jgi:hypothetical protein
MRTGKETQPIDIGGAAHRTHSCSGAQSLILSAACLSMQTGEESPKPIDIVNACSELTCSGEHQSLILSTQRVMQTGKKALNPIDIVNTHRTHSCSGEHQS